MGPAPLLSPPLVGRRQELAVLRQRWTDAGSTVVVRGVAGIGKSRLVRELTTEARATGAAVLTGRCDHRAGDLPLRPLREALLGAARSGPPPPPALAPFLPTLARLVPDWGPSQNADTSPLVLGEAILRLSAWSARPDAATLVVLEDLHWADDETVAVVEYMADNVAGLGVVLVATVRDGDPDPGPGADAVERLLARRAATEVRLAPLEPGEVAELARSCVPAAALSPAAVATLAERSEGIPFVVEELLTTAAASGDELDRALPSSIAASVAVRLATLPEEVVQLVRHAAVLGRHFDDALATEAAAVAPAVAPDLLRQAVRAQLLERDGGGFRFRHALTRDAVLADLLTGEAAVLAERALAALLRRDPALAGEHLHLAARLAELSGRHGQAARWMLEAVRRSLALGSFVAAASTAEHARELGTALGPGFDLDFDLEVDEVVLELLVQSGRLDGVDEVGGRLVASTHDPDRRRRALMTMAGAAIAAGRWGDATDHLAEAGDAMAHYDPRRPRLDVLSAHAALGRDDAESAMTLARRALAGAGGAADRVTQCEALEVIGRIERLRDLDASEEAFTRAHDIARAHGLALWRIRALQELGATDMYATLATERLEAARREALAAGALSTAAIVDLQLGAVLGERMELDAALASLQRCQDASARFGLSTLPMSLTLQAVAHAKAGRRAEADQAAAAARALGTDTLSVEITLAGNADASYHLHRGDLPAAAEALERSMEWLRRYPVTGFPFPGVWALLRTVLDDDGAPARHEIRSLPFDTPMSRLMLDAADAVALGREGDAAGAEATFAVTDTGLARYQRGYRRSLMRLLVAPSAQREGWGQPVVWLREAIASFELLGLPALARDARAALRAADAPVPRQGRGDAVVPPSLAAMGITSREVDVLVLAAAGVPTREIAGRLFLSPRTVEKHIERLTAKAGTNRAGLAALARQAGLS